MPPLLVCPDIAYADPGSAGKKQNFVLSKTNPPNGLDKFNPFVWDVHLGREFDKLSYRRTVRV